MKNNGLDRMEVKAIFRRTFACRSVSIESSRLDCMADAVGQIIEENNRKLLEELEITLTRKV